LTPPHVRNETHALVGRGGPRRLRPATHREAVMRGLEPSEFVR